MEYRAAGIVKHVYRFPVKSMQGQALQRGRVWWHGLDGDRRYAFVKTESMSSFPWLTGRDVPDLIRYAPTFVDPDNPSTSPLLVRTPAGRELPLASSELRGELAARFGAPIHLLHIGRGIFDSMPISIMSLSTVRALDERLHAEVDQRRFRANIVVETFEDLAHVEDEWLGKSVLFGDRTDSARVRADRPIPRCMMVNLHPETATQDSRILRALAHSHDANAAIYASTEAPGTIEEGDTVYISEASSPSFT